MDYKIVVDSCVDYNHELFPKEDSIGRVPFRANIDGEELIDIKTVIFDKLKSIEFKARSIRTACPSPDDFINAIDGARKAFIVTISSKLSGSHEAAELGRRMLTEEHPDSDIHVFDSETACAGETMVLYQLLSLVRENLPVQSIAEKLREYISGLQTLFVLDSMDTLVANGRVSSFKELALKALHIYPIMGDDGHGKIELKSLGRGKQKAFSRLIDMIGENKRDLSKLVCGISHCNAKQKALEIRDRIQERYPFQDVVIFECSGLSSVYASNGGIVIAY